jgi:uncharacterized membrane protein
MKILTPILLLALMAVIGAIEYSRIHSALRQHEAESFSVVRGEILSSEVTTYTGSKGHIYYHASFGYRYFGESYREHGPR